MYATLTFIAATTTTVAGSKKSSSSSYGLLIIVAVFAAAYFLLIRPRQQRMRQQQVAARQLAVGDEVVTAGGIHGRVVALGDDTVDVEVSPGVVLTFLRRAVNARPGAAQTDPIDDTGTIGGMTDTHDGDDDHLSPPPQAGDGAPGKTADPPG